MEGLPIAQLAQRGDVLAKRWAIALIVERPAQLIGDVALEEIARHGPELCGDVLQALGSDEALRQLLAAEASGPSRSGDLVVRLHSMAGARDAADAVVAVEALRGVLSQALAAELRASSARVALDPGRRMHDVGERLALAGERLAHVCALLAARAVAGAALPSGDVLEARPHRAVRAAASLRRSSPSRSSLRRSRLRRSNAPGRR